LCEQNLILSLLKITPRNFFIYLQKKLLPENFFGLKFIKKVFSTHLAVQQEQQMCSPRFDLSSLYTWELNFGPVQGHAHSILHHPLCFASILGTLNQEHWLHGLGMRWGSCWGGVYENLCIIFLDVFNSQRSS
jgi:hypothetical protein